MPGIAYHYMSKYHDSDRRYVIDRLLNHKEAVAMLEAAHASKLMPAIRFIATEMAFEGGTKKYTLHFI